MLRLLSRALLSWALVVALGALPVLGQHPLPQLHKPLHERVALSDGIALGEIAAVTAGRLKVRRVEVLRGEVPEQFEIKRSPLRPSPYEAGDLAVLFLRGARSPYVHADEPREMLRFEDAAATRRFASAVEALLEAGGDRDRLLELHREWLAWPDERMRGLAVNAFLLGEPPFGPLTPGIARELARAASDPERGLAERRTSALVAAARAEGLAELLARIPGPAGTADAEITATALRMGTLRRAPAAGDAILRSLAHPDPQIRRVGLIAASERGVAVPREVLVEMAENDPDADTRRRAARTLQSLER